MYFVQASIYATISQILSIRLNTLIRTQKGSTDIRRLQERVALIKDLFSVERIGIFGSIARGEMTPISDTRILVEFAGGQATFRNFMGLIQYLENLFDRKVDLVTTGGIDPYLKPYIEDEVIWCEA